MCQKCVVRLVNNFVLAGYASCVAFYTLAVSKQKFNHSGTLFRTCVYDLGFAAYEICCQKGPCGSTEARNFMYLRTYIYDSQRILYEIGTEL